MLLSLDDLEILATRHANSYEAAQLRERLHQHGRAYCSTCKTIQRTSEFPSSKSGRNGILSRCSRCDAHRRRRRVGYVPQGPRPAENYQRRLERNPEPIRAASRGWHEGNRTHKAVYKSEIYHARRSLGMSRTQAKYLCDWSEFADAWSEFLRTTQ